jgi:hypothetical protein
MTLSELIAILWEKGISIRISPIRACGYTTVTLFCLVDDKHYSDRRIFNMENIGEEEHIVKVLNIALKELDEKIFKEL